MRRTPLRLLSLLLLLAGCPAEPGPVAVGAGDFQDLDCDHDQRLAYSELQLTTYQEGDGRNHLFSWSQFGMADGNGDQRLDAREFKLLFDRVHATSYQLHGNCNPTEVSQ